MKTYLIRFYLLYLIFNVYSVVHGFLKVDFDKSMNIQHDSLANKIPANLLNVGQLFTNTETVRLRGLLFKQRYEAVFYENNSTNKTKIPKIIHHIWLGSKLPDNFKFCIESCKRQHPDWEHRLWTDADLKKYNWRFKDVLLSKNINPGKKSDILRLEILFKYGGVYLDTDFFCCKPLDALHKAVDFYGCVIDDYYSVANGVIGAAPGHKLIGRCLDALRPNDNNNHENIMLNTGPYFLTAQIVAYLNDFPTSNIVMLPRNYFFAMPSTHRSSFWEGIRNLNFAKKFEQPESLALHLWATSWQHGSNSKKNSLYDMLKQHKLLFVDSYEPDKLIQARRIEDNATPLIVAVQKNLINIVDALGRNGADFNAQDKYGYNVLYYARKNAQLELVELIKAYNLF